jgi:hypothetical protein
MPQVYQQLELLVICDSVGRRIMLKPRLSELMKQPIHRYFKHFGEVRHGRDSHRDIPFGQLGPFPFRKDIRPVPVLHPIHEAKGTEHFVRWGTIYRTPFR